MKVITIKQPWAWLILHGFKDMENRTWYTRHRGPLAIHASARLEQAQFDAARDIAEPLGIEIPDEIETGAILGTVELTKCVTNYQSPWAFGPYHFILKNPELLAKPIPARGQLWIWDGPDVPRRNH